MDKKLLTVFPYYKNPENQYFPIIPLVLHSKNINVDTSALIDSGATISVFRKDVADYLGIKIEEGEEVFLGGVGGRIKGYVHNLMIEISGKKFLSPIVFSHEYLVSFNLLGRAEFFKRYKITFEEKQNRIILE